MLYNQSKNGTRYLSGYAKDLDSDFLNEIICNGVDTAYTDLVDNFRNAYRTDIKHITRQDLKFLVKTDSVEMKKDWIINNFNSDLTMDDHLVEIILDLILVLRDKDLLVSELKSELKDLEDQLLESLTEYFETDSNTWILKTKNYTVSYSNNDNSYTVTNSKLTGRFLLASPCFPNGCYSEPSKKGLKAFRLPLNCYSAKYLEINKDQINWKR